MQHNSRPIPSKRLQALSGFTLIEVLVVVAIVALLVSILLPSIAAARDAAKVSVCQSNMKQVGNMASCYQADYRGKVPVLFAYGSATFAAGTSQVPARIGFLSLALRRYSPSLRDLKGATAYLGTQALDPETHWSDEQRRIYQEKWLPNMYVCPFTTGGKEEIAVIPPANSSSIGTITYRGKAESYHTWMWENTRGHQISNVLASVPSNKTKYTNTTWNRLRDHVNHKPRPSKFANGDNVPEIPGAVDHEPLRLSASPDDPFVICVNAHREWTNKDATRLRVGSLSDLSVTYCNMGEHMQPTSGWANKNSHRRGAAGTNLLFADMHVDWAKGSQVVGQ